MYADVTDVTVDGTLEQAHAARFEQAHAARFALLGAAGCCALPRTACRVLLCVLPLLRVAA